MVRNTDPGDYTYTGTESDTKRNRIPNPRGSCPSAFGFQVLALPFGFSTGSRQTGEDCTKRRDARTSGTMSPPSIHVSSVNPNVGHQTR